MLNKSLLLYAFVGLTLSNASAQLSPNKLAKVYDPGVPAYPDTITYTQPNGTKLKMFLKGDGNLSWGETLDGYKLLNNNGAYCYAIPDATNGISPSGIPASNITERSRTEISLLKQTSKATFFSSTFLSQIKQQKVNFLKSGDQPLASFPTSGNRRLLAILVEFTDVSFTNSQQTIKNLFNTRGYSDYNATGSVADYFYDNSFGKMNLTTDVVGPYRLSNNMAYYGAKTSSSNDANPREMVKEALALANPDVDYSNYDNDKDGTIDGVYIIFAGYGEEAGASSDAIWSHAWNIPSVYYDNTYISDYSCSPELKGNSSSNSFKRPTNIGVICHEFLHVCGLPDLYDTDGSGSGGSAQDVGFWDPMASGSWNNSGITPPFVNSYSRNVLGWGSLSPLTKDVNMLQPHYNTPFAYYASNISGESFVFENRQKVSWDSYLPYHGMLVYHIQYNQNAWNNNTINANPTHQYFDIVESNGGGLANAYTPFPGAAGNTAFTIGTIPAFQNWDGSGLKLPITEIKESGGVITFNVKNVFCMQVNVTDGTSAMSGAKVTLQSTGQSLTTSSTGSIIFNKLALTGNNQILTIQKDGYETLKMSVVPPTAGFTNDTTITATIGLRKRNIYLHFTNSNIQSYSVTYNGAAYSYSGSITPAIPVIGSINSLSVSVAIPQANTFDYLLTLNATDSIYTVPLKMYSVYLEGNNMSNAQAAIALSNLSNFTLAGLGVQHIFTPYITSAVSYTATLSNNQVFTGTHTPTSTADEEIPLKYNMYEATVTNGTSTLPNIELQTSGFSITTDMQGKAIIFTNASEEKLTVSTNTTSYQNESVTVNNLIPTSPYITINLVKRAGAELFTIAPNPIAEQPVSVFCSQDGFITIYSTLGNIIHKQNVYSGKNLVNAVLPKGLLLVRFTGKDSAETKRAIIL